ncbi:MAG TPA: dehydrogenase, partial [Planctomycetaceae bacterium]|nr:dehydrogenase [Planctomycetaceae bacterium]
MGTGFIGPVHVEALRRAGVHVAGIVGSSEEKSKAAAERLGLEPRFSTLDDVLSASDIDSVHLTTPNRFHFDQVSRALGAGKHVLCEKPLAMTSAETSQLLQLAEKSDRITAVAYNIRYYPLNHHAAALVHEGDLGSILHVNGSYVQDWLLSPHDFNWRVLASEGGALRAVADIGTHWLDLLQYITGQKIVRVFADLQ